MIEKEADQPKKPVFKGYLTINASADEEGRLVVSYQTQGMLTVLESFEMLQAVQKDIITSMEKRLREKEVCQTEPSN